MTDDTTPAASLSRLSDAELQALAYGRTAAATTDKRMRAAAATELASRRRPATAAAAGHAPGSSRNDLPAATETMDRDASGEPLAADATDVEGRPAHPHRRRIVAAAVVALAAIAITAIALSVPRAPAAFATLDQPPTAQDSAAEERLRTLGEPLYSSARVLDTLPLETYEGPTGDALRLVGFRLGAEGAPQASRQVCAVVVSDARRWSRTCVPEADFGEGGITVEEFVTGATLSYGWGSDGTTTLGMTPTGPNTLADVTALGLPAVSLLAESVGDIPDPVLTTVMATVRPSGQPQVRLGPALLTTGDNGWILIGELTDSPTPTGELQICITATRLGIAAAPVDHRCTTVSQFVDNGIGSDPGPGVGPVSFQWSAGNGIRLDVLPSGRG